MCDVFSYDTWTVRIHSRESLYLVRFTNKVNGEFLLDEYVTWCPLKKIWGPLMGRPFPFSVSTDLLNEVEYELCSRSSLP